MISRNLSDFRVNRRSKSDADAHRRKGRSGRIGRHDAPASLCTGAPVASAGRSDEAAPEPGEADQLKAAAVTVTLPVSGTVARVSTRKAAELAATTMTTSPTFR